MYESANIQSGLDERIGRAKLSLRGEPRSCGEKKKREEEENSALSLENKREPEDSEGRGMENSTQSIRFSKPNAVGKLNSTFASLDLLFLLFGDFFF